MRPDLCLHPKRFTRADVLESLPAIEEAMKRRSARLCYLLGSTLEDRMTPLSDVDFAILPDPSQLDFVEKYTSLYDDLCRIFHADNIDVILLQEAPPLLQWATIRDGLLLYAVDEATRIAFVEDAIFQYHDVQRLLAEHGSYLHQRIREGLSKAMRKADRTRVNLLLSRMDQSVFRLKELAEGLDEEQFLDEASWQRRGLVEHFLRLAIESALDVGRHLIAAKGFRIPEEYRQLGRILGENRIIPRNLAEKLVAMAGLRNVLVHLYWDVDYRLLYQIITTGLSDSNRFAQCIQEYLERES